MTRLVLLILLAFALLYVTTLDFWPAIPRCGYLMFPHGVECIHR